MNYFCEINLLLYYFILILNIQLIKSIHGADNYNNGKKDSFKEPVKVPFEYTFKGVVPEVLLSSSELRHHTYDYRREYEDFSFIYLRYLHHDEHYNCRKKCHSSINQSPKITNYDLNKAYEYADREYKKFLKINNETLSQFPNGNYFRDIFLYNATLESKYNQFVSEYITRIKCLTKAEAALILPSVPIKHNEYCFINFAKLPKGKNIVCDANAKYSRIDGKCNNIEYPYLGSAFHCSRRILPADYADGIGTFRESVYGTPLPNVRILSTEVLLDFPFLIDKKLTALHMEWGQFITHDTTKVSQYLGSAINCCPPNNNDINPECVPITFPVEKRKFRDVNCFSFQRSLVCNTCTLGPRNQINSATAYFDLSQIYGGSLIETSNKLRTKGGKMLVTKDKKGKHICPALQENDEYSQDPLDTSSCNTPGNNPNKKCFLTGDGIRGSQHPGLISIMNMILRAHNQHAEQLAKVNPQWDDDKLFYETRRIMIAEYNFITFNEYFGPLIGNKLMKFFKLKPLKDGFTKYDPHVDPSSIQCVTSSVHRAFGHSQTHGKCSVISKNQNSSYFLKDNWKDMTQIWDGNTDYIIKGLTKDKAMDSDGWFIEDLWEIVLNSQSNDIFDLIATDLYRGRDHGIPPYVYYVEYCTGFRIKSWDDFLRFIQLEDVNLIKSYYDDWRDVDLYVGGAFEIPISDSILGPTFASLISIQFYHRKFGDRYFFEHGGESGSFTLEQLNEIRRKSSLANLICKTTDIEKVQEKAMLQTSSSNREVYCDTFRNKKFNYDLWLEK